MSAHQDSSITEDSIKKSRAAVTATLTMNIQGMIPNLSDMLVKLIIIASIESTFKLSNRYDLALRLASFLKKSKTAKHEYDKKRNFQFTDTVST